jgi:hypothetical protein
MRLLKLVGAFALLWSPALADPSGLCMDRTAAKDNFDRRGGSFVTVTPEQWQFLRGIFAMNPATPPGLPFGDSAVIARIPGDQGAIILFIDGNSACTPMPVPDELIEMLDRVGGGEITHPNGPA